MAAGSTPVRVSECFPDENHHQTEVGTGGRSGGGGDSVLVTWISKSKGLQAGCCLTQEYLGLVSRTGSHGD